ncbi:trypsin-like serine protease [Methylocaldum szegediense]|uniref:Trypsin n=1 Tax=Methylocaldum szegediense TaxID=73780 RepID=A0ABN8X6X4_9GAMM|nr:trypsin-like serine protease [Methylocaldum szegediense]CAI8914866.1 Trypsin [Methylocaldum szegediense]
MNTFVLAFALIVAVLSAGRVFALIHGEPLPIGRQATLPLTIELRHWDAYQKVWKNASGVCSSTVLGTRPLTLITAAHCMRDVRLEGPLKLPAVRFRAAPSAAVLNAQLRAAVYPSFDVVQENIAEDIAILVFDADVGDELRPLPIATGHTPDKALICGFGYGYRETEIDSPRCAEKRVFDLPSSFYQFVPKQYEDLDPILHLQFRVQFESKESFVSSLSALLAVNRLDAQGAYSVDEPMPTRGDSGGPWIAKDSQGNVSLLAITSFVETFYRKNKQWPFFNGSHAPLSDLAYVAYGVRLDTREARARIEEARRLHADIREIPVAGRPQGLAGSGTTETR